MVRLNYAKITTKVFEAMFQFQNGSIKFAQEQIITPQDSGFQFQNGSIKLDYMQTAMLIQF